MPTSHHNLLHRFAVITAIVSLLPIVVGAVVTSLNAGMAFADWPSSDGHNMFFYPWLRSAGDKFIEHGHRLAGALIGLVSIGLAGVAWWKEPRRWVRWLATLALLAVIAQGLLGGMRVVQDQRLLAMIHGAFAALVFSLFAVVALVTGKGWFGAAGADRDADVAHLKAWALATPVFVFGQYLVGGLLRHFHTALHEHLAAALMATLMVLITAVSAHFCRLHWIRQGARWMLAALFLQLVLGAGAWVTRFGFPTSGYVAVDGSVLQTALRTGHTVTGMLLLMTSILLAVQVSRVDYVLRLRGGTAAGSSYVASALSAKGGAV